MCICIYINIYIIIYIIIILGLVGEGGGHFGIYFALILVLSAVKHFPLVVVAAAAAVVVVVVVDWSTIHTTNFRFIACRTPEDLAPNRLGIRDYPRPVRGDQGFQVLSNK